MLGMGRAYHDEGVDWKWTLVWDEVGNRNEWVFVWSK